MIHSRAAGEAGGRRFKADADADFLIVLGVVIVVVVVASSVPDAAKSWESDRAAEAERRRTEGGDGDDVVDGGFTMTARPRIGAGERGAVIAAFLLMPPLLLTSLLLGLAAAAVAFFLHSVKSTLDAEDF